MQANILSDVKVQLKPYSEEHIDLTVQWLKADHIQRTFGIIDDITVETHRKWLANNPEVHKWAITAPDYVGNILLFPHKKHFSAYLQIYIGSLEHIGQGIGYQAMKLVLDKAFNEIGLHRVWLHCLPDNLPGVKLYKKLNFSFEGIERESCYRQGKFHDMGRWSLLSTEWIKK